MNFSQRFRYNEMAQRYAIYSDLWRKKNRIREEGYRRPQDAMLSVQGVRPEEREKKHKVYGIGHGAAAGASRLTTAVRHGERSSSGQPSHFRSGRKAFQRGMRQRSHRARTSPSFTRL